MVVHKVANDTDFTEKLNQGGSKLVVIDFSATWWVMPIFKDSWFHEFCKIGEIWFLQWKSPTYQPS